MECLKCKYELLLSTELHDWDTAYDGDWNCGDYTMFERTLANGAVVQTWDKHDVSTWGPQYYEGEYEQGSEFPAWVVLRVVETDGTELYFKKQGTANSYGRVSWDKPMHQVRITEKVVQVFENMYEAI